MKVEIPRNSCLAQWRRREVERENSLYPHPKFSLGIDLYSKVDVAFTLNPPLSRHLVKNGVLD